MPPRGRTAAPSRSRRIRAVLWSLAAFFALGYFPTMLLRNPVPSIAVAACLVIPYGSKSASVRQGAFRGACLGAVAGVAVTAAVAALLIQGPPGAATRPAGPATTTTRLDKPAVPPTTSRLDKPAVPPTTSRLDKPAVPPGTTRPDKPPTSVETPRTRAVVAPAASGPAQRRRVPIDLAAIGSRLIGGTAVLCAGVAALFAHLAHKRRQRIEDEWNA